VGLERALLNGIQRLALFLMFATHKIQAFNRQLPRWTRFLLRLWYYMNNAYYYVELLLDCFTNVRARNPDLNLDLLVRSQWAVSHCLPSIARLYDRMYAFLTSNQTDPIRRLLMSQFLEIGLAFCLLASFARFSNKRDRAIFLFLMVAVMFCQGLVVAAIHPDSKEKIVWTLLGTTKEGIGGIAARHRSYRRT
jgi:hypothetical protein